MSSISRDNSHRENSKGECKSPVENGEVHRSNSRFWGNDKYRIPSNYLKKNSIMMNDADLQTLRGKIERVQFFLLFLTMFMIVLFVHMYSLGHYLEKKFPDFGTYLKTGDVKASHKTPIISSHNINKKSN